MTRKAILVEFNAWDPGISAAAILRVTSENDRRVTALNNVAWTPALARRPNFSMDLFDGAFTGAIDTSAGELVLSLAAMPALARMAWADRPVKIWAGAAGAAWGDYDLIFDGFTVDPRTNAGLLSLGLKPNDAWFVASPLNAVYAGSGGVEGGADLAGQPKPMALGRPRNIEPKLIDSTNNVYQFHGYGRTRAVLAAFENGTQFPAASGNFADYAALVAATIAPGFFATSLNAGLVRFGAPPTGVITLDVEGDDGSALGWVRQPGAVIQRLAELAGAAAGQIDTASLAALNAAVPRNISLYLTRPTTAQQVIQSVAQSCNAAAGIDWLSKLFVARTVLAAPAMTLASDGSARPAVASVERLETASPFWRMQMGADRAWRVHGFSEVAFTAPLEFRGPFDGATQYREGNIVEHQGFQYLYIAATPTAGNTPPDGNFWQKMSGQSSIDWSTVTGAGKPEDGADVTGTSTTVFVQNPGFEKGDTGWDKDAGFVIEQATALSGSWRARFTGTGQTALMRSSTTFAAVENARYKVSAYIRPISVTAGHCDVAIAWEDAAGTVQLQSVGTAISTGLNTWQLSEVIAKAPSGLGVVRGRVRLRAISASGEWHFDSVVVGLMPQNAEIDALETTNGPAESGADVTKDHAGDIITRAAIAPANPTVGTLWGDTSVTPNLLKRWDGAVWATIATLNTGALADLDEVATAQLGQGAAVDTFIALKTASQPMLTNTLWQSISNMSVTISAASTDKVYLRVGLDFVSISRDDRAYKFEMRLLQAGATVLDTRSGWAGEAETDRTTTPTSHYFNGSVDFIVDGDGASRQYTVEIRFVTNEQGRLTFPDALTTLSGGMAALHLKKAD